MDATLKTYSAKASLAVDLTIEQAMRGMFRMMWDIANGNNAACVYWIEVI